MTMKKPNGYWNLENTLEECKKIVEKYKELPSSGKLKEINRMDLDKAIQKNGGYCKIKEKLGLKEKERADGYWNLKNTIAECKKIVEKYGELPSSNRLNRMNMSSLGFAIYKNGGFPKIKKILGLKIEKKSNGYWTLENTIAECKKIVEKYGNLPSECILKKMNMGNLSEAVQKNGGFIKIREKLGVKNKRKPEGYWNLENTLSECKKLVEKYGELPSQSQLNDMKMSSLVIYITKYGGYTKIRKSLGIKKKNYLEQALEEYVK